MGEDNKDHLNNQENAKDKKQDNDHDKDRVTGSDKESGKEPAAGEEVINNEVEVIPPETGKTGSPGAKIEEDDFTGNKQQTEKDIDNTGADIKEPGEIEKEVAAAAQSEPGDDENKEVDEESGGESSADQEKGEGQSVEVKDSTLNKQINIYKKVINIGKDDFKDPTSPYSIVGDGQLEIPANTLNAYRETLEKKRILIASCMDKKVLSGFPATLLEKTGLTAGEVRILFFDGKNANEDINVTLFAENSISKKKPLVIIAKAVDDYAQTFLDSLLRIKDSSKAKSIRVGLENQQCMIICTVYHRLLDVFDLEKQTLFFIPEKLDFLPHLLNQKDYSSETINELLKEMKRQQKLDLWDANEYDFYEYVHQLIENDRFEEEVEKRKNPEEFRKEVESDQACTLFRDNDPVKNTVLYAATYFPGIDYYEFDLIVGNLLEAQDQEQSGEEESGNKGYRSRAAKVRHLKVARQISLTETWRKNSDNILRSCCIEVGRSHDSTQSLNFSSPMLRKRLKAHLERKYPAFLARQFICIQASDLLFHDRISKKLLENIIRLFVVMISANPDRYGKDWFHRVVETLRMMSLLAVKEKELEEERRLELMEKMFFHAVRQENVRHLVYGRLGGLFQEMFSLSRLKETVEQFLNELISMKEHDMAFGLVQEITRRLRFVPQFDYIYWMKQLLDRGSDIIREKTYHALLTKGRLNTYELLELMKTWLPPSNRDIEDYSFSNKYALRFVVDLSIIAIITFNADNFGGWPSLYPLFADLDEENAEDRMEMLVEWLFHPGIKGFFVEKLEIDFPVLISHLFLDWFQILHGSEKDFSHPEASNILNILLRKVMEKTKKNQQRVLISEWVKFADAVQEDINASRNLSYKDRKRLNRRRNYIRYLLKRFKRIQRDWLVKNNRKPERRTK